MVIFKQLGEIQKNVTFLFNCTRKKVCKLISKKLIQFDWIECDALVDLSQIYLSLINTYLLSNSC